MSETFFAKFIKAHPQYSEMAQSFKDPSVFTQEILLEHARQIDTNPSLATFLYDSYEKQGLRPIVLTALVKFARNFVDVERLNYMNRWESFLGDYIEQLNKTMETNTIRADKMEKMIMETHEQTAAILKMVEVAREENKTNSKAINDFFKSKI